LDIILAALQTSLWEGLAYGFVAIGVYLTFRVLGFPDLTVDGSFTLGAALVAVLIVGGVNPFLATLAALGAGLCAGLATALLNTKLRIPALLAGILMMVALYSINLRVMDGAYVSLLHKVTIFRQVSEFLGIGIGINLKILLAGALAVIVFLILNWFLRTEIGLALRATGDNEQMVRGLGADTDMTTILGVSISNGLVALAGAVVAQAQGSADAGLGVGMIVMGLASVIIGEALFRPRGVARLLLAAIGGTFVYRLMITIALRLGMAPGDLKLITAALVIIALAIPFIQKKVRREWLPPAAKW
jgi:putative ABC transport system permease protein